MKARFRSLLAALATLVAIPAAASAQVGSIAGTIRDAATRQPIPDVTVFVVGSPRAGRTDDRGAFRINQVPAGTVTIRAVRIGYSAKTKQVTVGAGEIANGDLDLGQSLRSLDQVVVTATGETQRKREAGNSIGDLNLANVPAASAGDFSNTLAARVAGVNVASSGGTAGTGARIRIRGSNSVSLSNDPLLVIDGVRINASSGGFSIGVGGQSISRFDDLNPEEIETIEVIKGPAGVALYGVQAANGVIQVTTKRGKVGKAKWQAFGQMGVASNIAAFPTNYGRLGVVGAGPGTTTRCNLDQQAYGSCTPVASASAGRDSLYTWNPLTSPISPIRTGPTQQFGVSVSGGSEAAQYFIAADQEKNQGVYDSNRLYRNNLRANISAKVNEDFKVGVQAGYVQSRLELPQNDNNLYGVLGAAMLGGAIDCSPRTPCGTDTLSRGYAPGQDIRDYVNYFDTRQDVERVTLSTNLSWVPSKYLTLTAVSGMDQLSRFDYQTVFPGFIRNSADLLAGSRTGNRINVATYTSNVSATSGISLTKWMTSTTTVGAQYISEVARGTFASGIGLIPGTNSLNAVSRNFAVGESNSVFNTFGAFAQQQFAFRDRLFLTAGVRGDNNSAFGTNIGYLIFPTVSGSWVISEEGFFPKQKVLSSLRLRAATGQSGQRPGFRDAVTFYSPVSVTVAGAETPALTVSGAGNANLKAERTTETEAGFEAGLFNDRVVVDFTWFNKKTRDALIAAPLAPSLGSASARFVNVGEVQNKGVEALVTAKLINTKNLAFDLTVNLATLDNKLLNLGNDDGGRPIPPIIFGLGGATQRHQNGYPLGGFWDRVVTGYQDKNNDGIISRVNCPGQPAGTGAAASLQCEVTLSDTAVYVGNILPRFEWSVLPTLTLFKYVTVTANLNHRGGFYQNNSTEGFRCGSAFYNCRSAFDKTAPLAEQARAISWWMGTRAAYFEKSDFTRLRELNVRLTAPQSLATRLGLAALSVDVAGRNLALWTNYTGLDPEVLQGSQGSNFGTADFLTQPPLRTWLTRVNITF